MKYPLEIQNNGEAPIVCVIEPWAEEFHLHPLQKIRLIFDGPEGDTPLIQVADELVIVTGWTGSTFEIAPRSGCMIFIQDGKLLGVSRRPGTDIFGLPGGKSEPGEDTRDTAIRECLEETGLVVEDCEFFYSSFGTNFLCDTYLALKWSGEVRSSDEGDSEWITSEKLLSGHRPVYNGEILKRLRLLGKL